MLTLSFSALLLSIGCGLGFAASDYFRKAVPATCPTLLLVLYFIGGQIPLFVAWLVWSGEVRLTGDYWAPGLVDAACGLAGNLLFVAAVRRSPLSLMIPVLALVPAITAVAGAIVLGEVMTVRQMLGAALIVLGLGILFWPADMKAGALAALAHERGLPFMLLTTLCWSATPVLDKIATAASSVPMHGLMQMVLLVAAAAGWIVAREGVRGLILPPGAAKPLASGAVAAGFAYLCQLAAYMATMVALVELIKRLTGVLSALVVGRVMFGESLSRAKILGIAVILVGLPQVILN